MSAPEDPNQPKHSDYDEKLSIVQEHAAAAAREKPDPKEGNEPLSLWTIFIAGLALIVGAGYLGATNGGYSNSSFSFYDGYVPPERPTNGPIVDNRTPGEKWIAEGEKAYGLNCKSCHQANGNGIPGQYPPVAESEYVVGGTERLAMILLNGLNGPVMVKGKPYNGNMTPWRPLGNKKIAQIMSYIRTEWGNDALLPDGETGIVTEEMVAIANEKHDIPAMTIQATEGFDVDLPGGPIDLNTLQPVGADGAAPATEEAPAE